MIAAPLRAWLAAGAIFVFGLAAGGAGTAWAGVRYLRQALQNPAGARGFADRAADRNGAQLTDQLDLTPEESARVQAALDQSAANLKAIRAQAALRVGLELRATNQRILATLPPAKHAAYFRIIAQRYERLGLTPPDPEKAP